MSRQKKIRFKKQSFFSKLIALTIDIPIFLGSVAFFHTSFKRNTFVSVMFLVIQAIIFVLELNFYKDDIFHLFKRASYMIYLLTYFEKISYFVVALFYMFHTFLTMIINLICKKIIKAQENDISRIILFFKYNSEVLS